MISKKEEDILKALKGKLLETKSVTDNDFFDENDRTTSKCIYYLRRFEKNVPKNNNHCSDFDNGKGGELKENRWKVIPMASLRSSAALIWNIFGDNKTCQLNKNRIISAGEYELEYEWNKSETIHGHYANLDAYLHSGNCHLFVEMKMLEPLTRCHPFKSYQQYQESDCPQEFKKAFDKFVEKPPLHFDAFQMVKHLLAIYNHFKNTKYEGRQKVVLLNCHWEPSKIYIDDHSYSNRTISLKETYEKFQHTADRFVAMQYGEINFKSLFDSIGVDLELATCNHRELIKIVGKGNDKYLERYEIR